MERKTRIWISFVLIFLFGVAVGITGTNIYVRSHIHDFIRGGAPAAHTRVIRRILHDMDLSDAQRDRIEEIMDDSRPEIEELAGNFGDSMREITEELLDRIREVLKPEQREMLDRRIEEFQKRFRRMFHHRKKDWRGPSPFEHDSCRTPGEPLE